MEAKKNPLSMQIDPALFEAATEDEKRQADVMSESTTFFKDGMRKLMKNPLAVGSIIVLLFIILTITIAPLVVPYTYSDIIKVNGKRDRSNKNLAAFEYSEMEQKYIDEGGEVFPHIMGTDSLGRDYFIRVVYGARISDLIMMRIVDIIYSLPDMLIIILLATVLQPILENSNNPIVNALGTNMICIFIVFGLLYWVGMARLVRGQILTIKNNEYILAARSIGAKPAHIIRKHIIPNCISVIIITTALQIPSAIFTESFLSFIGMGVNAPMPSLGSLANSAREGLQTYPMQLVYPAVLIVLIVLAFNLLGDGLRDAFDPKLRSK